VFFIILLFLGLAAIPIADTKLINIEKLEELREDKYKVSID
jgi:hypothetical protein